MNKRMGVFFPAIQLGSEAGEHCQSSASGREVFEAGEDMVVEHRMTGAG